MKLRVLVIDANETRAAGTQAALAAEGCIVLTPPPAPMPPLADLVQALRPDAVLIEMDNPNRDALEQAQILQPGGRGAPILLFAPGGDEEAVAEALRAGVSAYAALLDLAIAHFRAFSTLKAELAAAQRSLADRKLIERAKGIVMRERGCEEEEAYRHLRRLAMDRGQRLSEIAQQIITVAELLSK
jgi:response regulator NasT